MSVSLTFRSELSALVAADGELVDPGNNTVLLSGLNESGTYDATTSVPVTKAAAYEVPLTAGAATIDLTALVGLSLEEVVDGTGLKAQFVKFKNKSSNANLMTVTRGASNGWGPDAAGSAFTIPMSPGQSHLMSLADASIDVAAGDRTIDVSGTGAQVLQIEILLG